MLVHADGLIAEPDRADRVLIAGFGALNALGFRLGATVAGLGYQGPAARNRSPAIYVRGG